ncbi:MAG: hypothetical protein ACFE9Z_09150 [Promethearchaeota archaeon]
MLRTFIFDESKSHWIEEEQDILPHDICAILDEDQEILYFWSGQRSKKAKFRKAHKQLKALTSNFPELNIQLIMSKKNFPNEIHHKINLMLESSKLKINRVLKFSRFTSIRIYTITLILAVFLPIFLLFYLGTSLSWESFYGNYQISNLLYNGWINNSKVLIIIIIILFSINLLLGIIENEHQVIIFSLIGIIISLGEILYLNQGIFLFIFQEGSTLTNYLISQKDIWVFLLLNLIAILIFEIPNIFKLLSFFKTYRKFIF